MANINKNYYASQDLRRGMAVCFDTTAAAPCLMPAVAGSAVVGVVKHDCRAGDGVTLQSFETGGAVRLLLGEDCEAGDILGLSSDTTDAGYFFKTSTTGSRADYVLTTGGAAGLTALGVCFKAVDDTTDQTITGDLDVGGDLTIGGVIGFDSAEVTAPTMDGEMGINPGGVYLTASNVMTWPVGAIGFFAVRISGVIKAGSMWAASYFNPSYFSVEKNAASGALGKAVILTAPTTTEASMAGTWKILTNGRGGDEYEGFVLAQRIL